MTAVMLQFLTRRLHQLLTVIRGRHFFRALPRSCARGQMIPDISSLITAGAMFVYNHSGGKDGQAMLIHLLEVIPPKQLCVAWRDGMARSAGAGPEASRGRMHTVHRRPCTQDHAEMVERRFVNRPEVPSWPSASTRQCTETRTYPAIGQALYGLNSDNLYVYGKELP
ncbi:Uncharacterised protein [Klebsiella pneumoniae]|nr:Uncharacterised protein [Klebsiella pneumoniae]